MKFQIRPFITGRPSHLRRLPLISRTALFQPVFLWISTLDIFSARISGRSFSKIHLWFVYALCKVLGVNIRSYTWRKIQFNKTRITPPTGSK